MRTLKIMDEYIGRIISGDKEVEIRLGEEWLDLRLGEVLEFVSESGHRIRKRISWFIQSEKWSYVGEHLSCGSKVYESTDPRFGIKTTWYSLFITLYGEKFNSMPLTLIGLDNQ